MKVVLKPERSAMPFPRPIDATLHGVTDYTAGTTLMTVFPQLAGLEGTESGRQIRIAGAIHAGYSTITDYPLGILKVIPYKAHLGARRLRSAGAGRDTVRQRPVEKGHEALGPARRPLRCSSSRR